jgi:hypothetical protein
MKMKHLFILILFTLPAGFIFAQAPEAVIREMTGTVELKTSGSAGWTAAKEKDRIVKDTVVSTGFKSTAILAVGNSTIVVRPLTRLSLAEIMNQNETETININLTSGRIRVDVKPPARGRANFTVQTPTATAAVRGTKFNMNTVKIQVLEGAVNYRPSKGNKKSVMVNAGQESWIDTGTDSAVNPAAAAESSRSLPGLPGQNSKPSSDNGARLEVPSDRNGTLTVDVTFDGD